MGGKGRCTCTLYTHKTQECTDKTITRSTDGLFFPLFPAPIKYQVSHTHTHGVTVASL